MKRAVLSPIRPSPCGLQVLSIPETGPGSLSQNAAAAVRTLAEMLLLSKIGDLSRNSNSAGIIARLTDSPAPKEVAVKLGSDQLI